MVELRIDEHCRNCPEFEVETFKSYFNNGEVMFQLTCQHRIKCAKIRRHLEQTASKEGTDDGRND